MENPKSAAPPQSQSSLTTPAQGSNVGSLPAHKTKATASTKKRTRYQLRSKDKPPQPIRRVTKKKRKLVQQPPQQQQQEEEEEELPSHVPVLPRLQRPQVVMEVPFSQQQPQQKQEQEQTQEQRVQIQQEQSLLQTQQPPLQTSSKLRPINELLTLSVPFYNPRYTPQAQTVKSAPPQESNAAPESVDTVPLPKELSKIVPAMMTKQAVATAVGPTMDNTKQDSPGSKKRSSTSTGPHRHKDKKEVSISELQMEVQSLKALLRMCVEYNGLIAEELMKVKGVTNNEPFLALKRLMDAKEWGAPAEETDEPGESSDSVT